MAQRKVALGIDPDERSTSEIEDMFERCRTLEEYRKMVGRFDPAYVLRLLCGSRSSGWQDCFLRGRLVRECLVATGPKTLHPGRKRLKSALMDAANLLDGALLHPDVDDLHERAMSRIAGPQFALQHNSATSMVRSLGILYDANSESSPIGTDSWVDLLGMALPEFLLGAMTVGGCLSNGPVDLLAEYPTSGNNLHPIGKVSNRMLHGALRLLAANLGELEAIASRQDQELVGSDKIYGLGPLAEQPIVQLANGDYGMPSQRYLDLATSPAALYTRLADADSFEGTMARRQAVGSLFHRYLLKYAEAELTDQWSVLDADDYVDNLRTADLVIVPPDRSFVVFAEVKAALQLPDALLGRAESLDITVDRYQRAFRQVDATPERVSEGWFPTVGDLTGVPQFGFVVTMGLHHTTTIAERTYPGIILDYQQLNRPHATSKIPTRVIQADDFEMLIGALARLPSADWHTFLNRAFTQRSMMGAPRAIASELSMPPGSDSNDFVQSLLHEFASIDVIGPRISELL